MSRIIGGEGLIQNCWLLCTALSSLLFCGREERTTVVNFLFFKIILLTLFIKAAKCCKRNVGANLLSLVKKKKNSNEKDLSLDRPLFYLESEPLRKHMLEVQRERESQAGSMPSADGA